ncbi:MAG: polysaccharide biosynthesis/export family protein, partial [Candidatus Krumholzibacteriota bacterium]
MKRKKSITLLMALFVINMSAGPFLLAQSITLGEGDRLRLAVQERPELDRMLVISEQNEVNIPETRPIRIGGLSLSDAESIILEKLREIYPDISQIELSLIGEEKRRLIYVQGQVVRPGRYEFVDPPNVWEVIREAGGASPSAALESVRIIRGRGDEQRTETVNLQRAIDSGDFSSLPVLRLGDTVFVPERGTSISAEGSVIVLGAIAAPGAYNLGKDKRLEATTGSTNTAATLPSSLI